MEDNILFHLPTSVKHRKLSDSAETEDRSVPPHAMYSIRRREDVDFIAPFHVLLLFTFPSNWVAYAVCNAVAWAHRELSNYLTICSSQNDPIKSGRRREQHAWQLRLLLSPSAQQRLLGERLNNCTPWENTDDDPCSNRQDTHPTQDMSRAGEVCGWRCSPQDFKNLLETPPWSWKNSRRSGYFLSLESYLNLSVSCNSSEVPFEMRYVSLYELLAPYLAYID